MEPKSISSSEINALVKETGNSKETNELRAAVKEKDEIIKQYDEKVKTLYDDFNYNVQLIYDRDREIEQLNRKIEELQQLNHEKDMQIVSMKSLYTKVSQLETDKLVLTRRIEALVSGSRPPTPGERKVYTPRLDESRNTTEKRLPSHKKYMSADRISHGSEEFSEMPLSKLNSDLERRIKALEQENKGKKYANKSYIEVSEQEPLVGVNKERFANKEKEISELIKSLSPYKKDSSRSKMSSAFDGSKNYLAKDLERLQAERFYAERSSSRASMMNESVSDVSKHEPAIKCGMSIEKKFYS